MTDKKIKILFICLGNICRSVAAEEVFRTVVRKRGLADCFEIDSAGLIDYHEGELADSRMRQHAAKRGYKLTHRSRPITVADFFRFEFIVAMDSDNVRRLRRVASDASQMNKVLMMADFLTHHDGENCVPDPYYGDGRDFEHVLDLLEDASEGLASYLDKRFKLSANENGSI